MITSIFPTICTADVAASRDFYVEHLGFRVASRAADEMVVEGYGMQIVFSPGPGGSSPWKSTAIWRQCFGGNLPMSRSFR